MAFDGIPTDRPDDLRIIAEGADVHALMAGLAAPRNRADAFDRALRTIQAASVRTLLDDPRAANALRDSYRAERRFLDKVRHWDEAQQLARQTWPHLYVEGVQ